MEEKMTQSTQQTTKAQMIKDSLDNLCADLVTMMNDFKAYINLKTETIKQAKKDILTENEKMTEIAEVIDNGAYALDCVAEELQTLTEDIEETFSESDMGEIIYRMPEDAEDESDDDTEEEDA